MVQVVKTKSWGSRLVEAFWGILIGIVLIIGTPIFIFWNEGNAIHTAQSLHQAQQVLISVQPAPIVPRNDLRVVYLSGLATTKDVLEDELLKLSENAIKLDRIVSMYQWQENKETSTEKELGGSEKEVTNYTYKQIWSDKLIDSTQFQEQTGHQNPTQKGIPSKHQVANKVTVGDFVLPVILVKKIDNANAVDLSKVDTIPIRERVKTAVHNFGEEMYVGNDPKTPQIGDLRIQVLVVLPQIVSIIGQQTEDTLQAFVAPAGKKVILLASGNQSADDMILAAQTENRIMTWIFRGLSLFLLIIGFALILKPLSVIADIVPFIGNLVGFGTGVVAFLAGLMLWSLVTALAWFTVRPLWALGLLAIAALICLLIFMRKKKQTVH